MSLRLLRTHQLTITRYDNVEDTFNPATGRFELPSISNSTFDIECSIQPFRLGDRQLVLPEGTLAEDSRFVYTSADNLLRTVSQFGKTLADTTVIDGRVYEAFNANDWTGFGLRTDNYKVIFVRQDLDTAGL